MAPAAARPTSGRRYAGDAAESEADQGVVSEAGASVYSASEAASNELPTSTCPLRGAVSIARRLQDPLAELVKIEPKAIGVGNISTTWTEPLGQGAGRGGGRRGERRGRGSEHGLRAAAGSRLRAGQVAGRGIVAHRNAQGAFKTRKELLKVARLGPKAFEQAAGFCASPTVRSRSTPLPCIRKPMRGRQDCERPAAAMCAR